MSDAGSTELSEILLRLIRDGGDDAVDEYRRAHPDQVEAIDELLPAMQVMEGLAATREAEGTPERVGDFVIRRELGRGGMGIVYEAQQVSLDRTVALKVLPQLSLPGRAVERFRREARAAARLEHDHIVPIYAVGEEAGLYYYAMKLIAGVPLDRALARLRAGGEGGAGSERKTEAAGSFFADVSEDATTAALPTETLDPSAGGPPVDDALAAAADQALDAISDTARSRERHDRESARVVRDVADALAHANDHGILHRDVKPSNLLLDAKSRIWVTDFGLAKAIDSPELTGSREVVGTPPYMAPERFDGWSDPRSDIYSLGLVLYELLTMRPAFRARNREQLVRMIIETDPVPPRRIDRRIPRDLETIALKAIEKEPGDRYHTAAAMRDDLDHFLAGRPIEARRARATEKVAKWMRRHPASATLVFVSMFFLVVLAAGAVWHSTRLDAALDRKDAALEQSKADYRRARRAVDTMSDFAETHLADLPFAEDVRRRFLEKSLAFYLEFVSDHGDDETLELDLVASYRRAANLRARLADLELAEAAFVAGLERVDSSDAAGGRDYRAERGQLLIGLATTLDDSGKSTEARARAKAAVDLFTELTDEFPRDGRLQEMLAVSHATLGLLLTRLREADAIGHYEASLDAFERCHALDPTIPIAVRTATIERNIAVSLQTRGDAGAAETRLERALARLGENDAVIARGTGASIFGALGNLWRTNGRWDEARDAFAKAVAIYDGLVAGFPRTARYRRHRAAVLVNQGSLLDDLCLHDQGCEHEDARAAFKRAAADQTELIDTFGMRSAVIQLARTHSNMGRSLILHGIVPPATTEAIPKFRQSLDLLAGVEDSALVRRERAAISGNMGLCLVAEGELEEALRVYESAERLMALVVAADPEALDVKNDQAGLLNNLGELMAKLDRPEDALEKFEAGLAISRKILEASPESSSFRLYQRNLRFNAGRAHLAIGDYEDAAELADDVVESLPIATSRRMAAELLSGAARQAAQDESLDASERERCVREWRAQARALVDQKP